MILPLVIIRTCICKQRHNRLTDKRYQCLIDGFEHVGRAHVSGFNLLRWQLRMGWGDGGSQMRRPSARYRHAPPATVRPTRAQHVL